MIDLSLCLPYYMNAGMLARHYELWRDWPSDVKSRVEIIVVDDASPERPAAEVARPQDLPTLSIYRVQKDIPWHQDAARNLGAHVALGAWLVLTDMDHALPLTSVQTLLRRADSGGLDAGTIYTLSRIDADTGLPTLATDGTPKPHSNSYLVSRTTYWHIGGYDESLCGIYGTDGLFHWRAFRKAAKSHLDDVALLRYSPAMVPDSETTTLPRKEGRDETELARRKAAALMRGIEAPVPVLTFEWKRVL